MVEIKNIFFQDSHYENFLNEIDESVVENRIINYEKIKNIQKIKEDDSNKDFRIVPQGNLEILKKITLKINTQEGIGIEGKDDNMASSSTSSANSTTKKIKSSGSSTDKIKKSNKYIYYIILVEKEGGKGSINGPFTTVSLKTYIQREDYFYGLVKKDRFSKYLRNLSSIVKNVDEFNEIFEFRIKTNYFDFESFYGSNYIEKIKQLDIKQFFDIIKYIKKMSSNFPVKEYIFQKELDQYIKNLLTDELKNQLNEQNKQLEEQELQLNEQKLQLEKMNNQMKVLIDQFTILNNNIINLSYIFNKYFDNKQENNLNPNIGSINTFDVSNLLSTHSQLENNNLFNLFNNP